ncbi:MAG: hypothetical protein ACR2IR_11180 [Acidimicrobiia bacterium]
MAYLLIVVGVSAVGIAVVLLRQRSQRGPRTMDASIDHFSRTRTAISPDSGTRVAPPPHDAVRSDQQRRHPTGDTGAGNDEPGNDEPGNDE